MPKRLFFGAAAFGAFFISIFFNYEKLSFSFYFACRAVLRSM